MDNASKFFIGLSLAAFLGAGGVATYYGIQYNNLKNSHEIIAEDTTGVKQRLKELNDRIDTLIQEKNTQQAQNQRLTQQNEAYLTIIEGLRDDLVNSNLENEELETQIVLLNSMLDDYENIRNQTSEINFYINNTIFQRKIIRNGELLTGINTPQDTLNYDFLGWSLDGENVIDLTNFVVTENMNFYAVLRNYVCNISDYQISNDGCIIRYTGTDENILLPSFVADIYATIPITEILDCAFSNNQFIRRVKIPGTVSSIEHDAFDHCNNLEYAYCFCENPDGIYNSAFPDSIIAIYIPEGSLNGYLNASFGENSDYRYKFVERNI